MKTWCLAVLTAAVLSACAGTGGGSTQIYGEITSGVETSRTRTGR